MRDYTGGVARLYYAHTDHLGTPKALSDAAARVVWRAAHDPYGAATVDEDPDGDGLAVTLSIRFPGQYHDAETGLHYNYHRYYDPETGQYTTSDPIGLAGGLNTYVYSLGNPVRHSDILGLEVIYNGYVVNNPRVRDLYERLDSAFSHSDVVVSGGDRYIDSYGDVRSSTTGEIVPGTRTTSPHVETTTPNPNPDGVDFGGARGGDFYVVPHNNKPPEVVSNAHVRRVLQQLGVYNGNIRQGYSDGHTHFNLNGVRENYLPVEILIAFCANNPNSPNCRNRVQCE